MIYNVLDMNKFHPEHVLKNVADFFGQNMLQLIDLARVLVDRTIPSGRTYALVPGDHATACFSVPTGFTRYRSRPSPAGPHERRKSSFSRLVLGASSRKAGLDDVRRAGIDMPDKRAESGGDTDRVGVPAGWRNPGA